VPLAPPFGTILSRKIVPLSVIIIAEKEIVISGFKGFDPIYVKKQTICRKVKE
jgi:hypothetical protein